MLVEHALERPMLSWPTSMQRESSHTAVTTRICSHGMAYDWHAMAHALLRVELWEPRRPDKKTITVNKRRLPFLLPSITINYRQQPSIIVYAAVVYHGIPWIPTTSWDPN